MEFKTRTTQGEEKEKLARARQVPQALVTMPPYAPYIEKVLKHRSQAILLRNGVSEFYNQASIELAQLLDFSDQLTQSRISGASIIAQ